MRARVSEPWVEAPLQRFADQSRVTFALLLQPSGQVLGQFGFTRAMDVMAACSLAAAINVTAAQMCPRSDSSCRKLTVESPAASEQSRARR